MKVDNGTYLNIFQVLYKRIAFSRCIMDFFFINSFYCLTYTTLPTLLTLIKILTPITLLTLRYITVLNTTLAKKYLQKFFHFCFNIIYFFFFLKQSFALLILLCLHHLNFLLFFKHTRTLKHTNPALWTSRALFPPKSICIRDYKRTHTECKTLTLQ